MADDDLHNRFFYANVCHTCKSSGNESILKRCGDCKLVSYCGRSHQKRHWRQHQSLCRVVKDILLGTNHSYLLEDKKNCSKEAWTQAKMSQALVVALKLQRQLLPYEEELFKFIRCCLICHDTNSQRLQDCQYCSSASFCTEHCEAAQKAHFADCAHLNLCLELDIASTAFGLNRRPPPCNQVPYHTEQAYLPKSIKHFITLFIDEDRSLPLPEEIRLAYVSQYYSRPLSLLYALEKLHYSPQESMTVHIIGSNLMELYGVEIWETLLHWLYQLHRLSLIFIGPEFEGYEQIDSDQLVCYCCREKGMELNAKTIGALYEDYVSNDNFEKPDIVVGYNTGLHECEEIDSPQDKWSASLRCLPQLGCPLVLTAYTEQEANNEHKRLERVLNTPQNLVACEKNPFASMRPHRDFENEGIFYQNQHIIIYHKLNFCK